VAAQRSSWTAASCKEEERWLSRVWVRRFRMNGAKLGDLCIDSVRARAIWREGNRFGARKAVLAGRFAGERWAEQEIERSAESPAESPATGAERATCLGSAARSGRVGKRPSRLSRSSNSDRS
jgi:hypothetical protein